MNWRKILSAAAAAVLTLSLFGCNDSSAASTEELDALKQENAQLRSQIEELSAQLSRVHNGSLESWSLTATPWTDSKGATITFTGNLWEDNDGQSALFSVRLNGNEIITLPCIQEGRRYTASVDLDAANGYSYNCILVNADGSRLSIPLSSPDSPTNDTLVYLESSLSAYCNLMITDWNREGDQLNITSGYAQVQLPRISPAEQTVELAHAKLVFQLNGVPITTQELVLPEGEGECSYESALADLRFSIPELEKDSHLELFLIADLSNGEAVYASGGSWFESDGVLHMSVG